MWIASQPIQWQCQTTIFAFRHTRRAPAPVTPGFARPPEVFAVQR